MRAVFSIFWCAIVLLATPVYLVVMGILFCGATSFHWLMRPARTHRVLTRLHAHT